MKCRLFILLLCASVGAGDAPTATVMVPKDVTNGPVSSAQEIYNYVTSVRPGSTAADDGETLCGGKACTCSASSTAMFAAVPALNLLTYTPTFANPTTGTLKYQFVTPIAGFPKTSTVACTIPDSTGASITIPTFTITANGFTWSPTSTSLTCTEDVPCTVAPLFTNLNDNNGGILRLPLPCPAGGSPTCFYELSSTDPRWTSGFFTQLPALSDTPSSGCTACRSDLAISLASDVNTAGTWSGVSGPISFTMVIRDDNGNSASPVVFALSVTAVNDPPTASISSSLEAVYNPSSLTYTYAKVLTNVQAGPPTATDEASQTLPATQTCKGNTSLFSGTPSIQTSSGTLTFTLQAGLQGYPTYASFPGPGPINTSLTCTLTDSGGASTTLPDVSVLIYPPNSPPYVSCAPACDVTISEDGTVAVSNYFTVAPSTPPGLSWEQSDVVTLKGCVITADTCVSTTGSCLSSITVTGTNLDRLQAVVVADAVGMTNFTCTFQDKSGSTTSATGSVNIVEVNDPPTALLQGALVQSTFYSNTNTITVSGFVVNIRQGNVGSVSEDSQVLCGGAGCACTATDASMFGTQPKLVLSTNTPTTKVPATASLVYAFATGLSSVDRSTSVVCKITDNAGGVLTLQTFTITATSKPTWTPAMNTVTCYEDGTSTASAVVVSWCTAGNFLTQLDDNNGGNSVFSTVNCPLPCSPSANPCPSSTTAGGGGGSSTASQCWYSATSSDPRFNSIPFLQVKPYFATAPAKCSGATPCSSDLVIQSGANANTGSSPIPLTITVRDSSGNAVSRDVSLVVLPVNDNPTFEIVSTSDSLQATGAAVTLPYVTVRPGPQTAVDEDGQEISASCTSSNPSLFSVAPVLVFNSTFPTSAVPASADIKFTLTSITTFPSTVTIQCTVTDSAGGSAMTPTFTLTIVAGPPTWVPLSFALTCDEDNSAAPSTTASPCVFTNFVSSLNDNKGGVSTFSTSPCPSATCWYELTSADSRWSTMFSVAPLLSAPTPTPCVACSSSLTFTLKDNFNTAGTPVNFTVLVRDSTGRAASAVDISLVVPAVDDLPTAAGGSDVTVAYTGMPVTVSNFITSIAPGPATAVDELSETVAISCTAANPSLFAQQPTTLRNGAAADLVFQVSGSVSFPASTLTTCVLTDSMGSSSNLQFTIAVTEGPPQWTPSTYTLSGYEDNSATPSTVQGASFVFSNFVTSLDANGKGSANFDTAACPSSPCWYSITTTDDALFSVMPSLSPPVCSSTCTSSLSFSTSPNTYGNANLSIAIRNTAGYASAPKVVEVAIQSVNDLPSAQVTAAPNQNVMWNDTTTKAVNYFLTNISAGPNEPTQVVAATCSNTNSAMFAVQPRLTVTGTYAALSYALAGGSQSASATVSCVLSDGMAQYNVPAFSITAAAIPTWALLTPTVTCYEDGVATATPSSLLPCYQAGFVTSLKDNNNGLSVFSETGCPTGPSCWYAFTSSDPRWAAMFKVPPTLTAAQVPCVGTGCSADLSYTLADNFNTRSGQVRFGVVLKDSSGRTAETHYGYFDVTPVNDAPTAVYPTAIVPNGQTVTNSFPGLFTNIQPGPVDEAWQNVTAVCDGSPDSVFASKPVLTVRGTTGDLAFTLRQAKPSLEGTINCTLMDNGVPSAQQGLQPIRLATLISWVSKDIVCSEDGSSLPRTAAVQCEVLNFVQALNDNNNGTSVFAAPWYEFSSTDSRWPGIIASGPSLTPVQSCTGTCVSHLTFTLANDANTKDGPIMLNVTIRDTLGRSGTKVVSLTVPPVNDYPTSTDPPSEVRVTYTDTSPQSRTLVTSVMVGTPSSYDEDSQVLCGGSPCKCSVSPNIFSSNPEVALTTYAPATKTGGTTGTLLFALKPGLTNLERSQVSCSLSDGSLTKMLTFVVTAEDPADTLCAPYYFPTGVETGSVDGCLNGTSLSVMYDPSCTVQCAAGYTGASTTITCPFTTSPSCVPNTCTNGVTQTSVSTDYTPCNALATGGHCSPTCKQGYHSGNSGFDLLCSSGKTYTDPYAVSTCVENTCLVSLPAGTAAGGADPCSNGMLLSTVSDTSCTIQCGVGYYDNNGTNLVTCPTTAAQGSQADVSAACIPSCALFTCPSGALKPNPSSIPCPNGVCNFTTCCISFCDSFAGCTAGYKPKNNSNTISCNGTTCTRDLCCDVSCSIATFTDCAAPGYVPRQPASEITCPQSGCNRETCCLATCDNTDFTACQHGYYALRPSPSFITCSGGIPARDCNIQTCCLSTCYINTFTCSSGLTKKLNPAQITCDATGCTEERCCDALCGSSGLTCAVPTVLKGTSSSPARCTSNLPSSCTQFDCCVDPCAAVVCTPVDECHGAGTCADGRCSSPLLPDGTPCTGGTCKSGNCLGAVQCGAAQCYVDACITATCSGGGLCTPVAQPNARTCSDNSALTVSDQCFNGVCTGVPKCQTVVCYPSDQCHDQGVCDPATGTCSTPLKPDGTMCDDGEDMTADDRCKGGVCVGRWKCAGVVCPFVECHTRGKCNITTEVCEYERVPDLERCRTTLTTTSYCLSGVCVDTNCGCVASGPCRVATCQGTSCSEADVPDGNPCMLNGTNSGQCSKSMCVPVDKCFGVVCPVHSTQCFTQSYCNNETGTCTDRTTVPNYTPCDDGLGTTINSLCIGGVCMGTPKCQGVVCPTLQCKSRGVCNDMTGLCEYGDAFNGIPCSDGIAATADTCIDGRCVGTLPCSRTTCTAEECMYPTCVDGKCSETPVTDGTSCKGGEGTCSKGVCMMRDMCDGVLCVPTGQCKAYIPCWNGRCADINKPDGTPCDDGNSDTANDACRKGVCVGTGGCACSTDECQKVTGCTVNTCNWYPASNGAPCAGGTCANSVCVPSSSCGPTQCASRQCYTNICNGTVCVDYAVPDGTPCNDQNYLTMGDACYLQPNKGSGCVGIDRCKGVTCTPISQCHIAGTCNALTGTCSTPPKPENSTCDDNNPATKLDRCVQGTCIGVTKCTTCPVLPCSTPGNCNPLTGLCDNVVYPDGAACDDGSPSTINDKCFKGTCVGSALCGATLCSVSKACHTPVCLQGSCTEAPMPDGTLCSLDGNFTSAPTCRNGVCVAPNTCSSLSCPQPSQCYEKDRECLLVDGLPVCTNPTKPNYTPCDDNNVRTTGDVCINGACVGTSLCASKWCPWAGQCYERTLCNATTGSCPIQPKPDGTLCSDGNPFTWDDRCYGGSCLGAISCVNATNGTCRPPSQCHDVKCVNGATCVVTVLTGAPCNDGDSTTVDDQCTATGACMGTDICQVACAPTQCQNSSWCDRNNGSCVSIPAVDGTPCDDGKAQTLNDQCVAGVCVGKTKCQQLVCVASDPCHYPGDCDENTGLCSNPNKPDGTKCDDGSSLTADDQCVAGVCTGTDSCAGVICQPQNDCYEPGTCSRGVCTNSMKADSTPCSNETGLCQLGKCITSRPCDSVVCQPSDTCHAAGTCNATTGLCSDPPVADGTACDDMHPETSSDQCLGGVCRGSVVCGGQKCIATEVCHVAFCSGTACTQLPLDAEPCNDNNPATYGDTCRKGVCIGTTSCDNVVCSTSDPCKTAGVCNPLNGQCSWTVVPDGTQCDDKNASTINDVCNVGVCKGELPCSRPCSASSECQVNGICDMTTGVCPQLPLPDLSPCNDNDANTVNDVCINGVCAGTISCDSVTKCRASSSCKKPVCSNNVCTEVNLPDGSVCTDFNSQTRGDVCKSGMCVGVATCTTVCTRLSQCHDVGVCDPITGMCSAPESPAGTPCDDGNPSTYGDNCANGACIGTQRCTTPCTSSDQCHVAGVCDPTTGICTDPMIPDNTPCDDGNPSTTGDICVNGVCVGGLLCGTTACYSTNQCETPQCNSGTCAVLPKALNSQCNDGNTTTFNDKCVTGAVCQGTALCEGKTCASRECFVSTCEPLTGACSYEHALNNTACDDGNPLTFSDRCSSGVCAGVSLCENVTCTALSSCHAVGVCDPQYGVCTNPRRPNNVACDDGNALTSGDVCVNGVCVGTLACGSSRCASTACGVPMCLDNATCTYAYKADGTACDDGNSSTPQDTCNGGLCVGRGPCWGVTCPPPSQCHQKGICIPLTGSCMDVYQPDGTPCDDKDANTRDDTCMGGRCIGQQNCATVTCAAASPCRNDGVCDPTDGLCTEPTQSDGTICDDNNVATLNDRCMSGTCVGVISCGGTTCASTDQCKVSFCDMSGVCAETIKADGTPCSDSNPRTLVDRCSGGVCTSVDLCKDVNCQGDMKCIGPGTCDPQTGVCSISYLPDNTLCNDGDDSTVGDKCRYGVCVGVAKCSLVQCDVIGQCASGGICDTSTGLCTTNFLPDSTPCSDGDTSTTNDTCVRGACLGGKMCGSTLCMPRGQCYTASCQGGACVDDAKQDGALCDDNNPSTVNDMCTGGVCQGRDLCEGVSCPSAGECQLDGVCIQGKCYSRPQPDGTTCDDGLTQTTNDRCVSGACVGYVVCGGAVCMPQYPQCQYPACNGTQCTELTKPDGTACNGGSGTTGNEQCLAGLCIDNSPCRGIVCKPVSQCYDPGVCEDDVFTTTGKCTTPYKVGAVPCDDNDPTTAVSVCSNGACTGTPKCKDVQCSKSDQCHTVGTCDPLTGLCSDPPAPDGQGCNDGDPASTGDQCISGVCLGVVTCGGTQCPRTLNPCMRAACDNNRCVTLRLDSVPCNDDDTSTKGDTCVNGVCVGIDVCTGVVCPQSSECIISQCQYGLCNTIMKPNNTVCNDNNAQTVNDRCVNGMCFGDNPCELGQCGSSCTGAADGTPCDDGITLSIDDRCVRGVCKGTYRCLGVTCSPVDDCHGPGSCDPFSGLCSQPVLPNGTLCNDGDATTVEDKCTGGVCIGRVKCGGTFCPIPSQCAMAYCRNDTCAQRAKYNSTPCDDGNTATAVDSCISGQCKGRDLCLGTTCTPSDDCHDVGECDTFTGRCSDPMKSDGSYCTVPQQGTCASGNCVPAGVPCGVTVCSTTSACHVPRCEKNVCILDQRPNYSPCNDNDAGTVDDNCFDGACRGVDLCAGVVCQDDQCHAAGTCNPLTGLCDQLLRKEGTLCNDGNVDTVNDMCMAGGCVGIALCGGVRCLPSEPQCKVAVCTGLVCGEVNAIDGTQCSDLNELTVGDRCWQGVCVGEAKCAGVVCQQTNSCMMTMTCDPRSGRCVGQPVQDGTNCTSPDGFAGICSSGTCNIGVPCGGVTCYSSSAQCYYAICKDGQCADEMKYNGAQCNDDNSETINDKCTGGVCSGAVPCAGVTCPPLGQCEASNTCNNATGQCDLVLKDATESCDDGDSETVNDRCIVGVCRGTMMCNGLPCRADNPQCQTVACVANVCVQRPKLVGTLCDDFNLTTTDDKCQADGVCRGRDRCEGVLCTSSRTCYRAGVCDPQTGLCSEVMEPDDTSCFGGTCLSGGCVATLSCALNESCLPLDQQCKVARCSGTSCIRGDNKPNGTPCSDGDPATFDDVCQTGKCVGVSKCANVVCVSSDPCRLDGTCNPATGLCSEPYAPDGKVCNDTNINTVNDACVAGFCRGELVCGSTMCLPSDPCKMSTCTNGACQEINKYDGTPCNDQREETFGDQCMAGVCTGVDRCAGVTCQPPGYVGPACYGVGECDLRTGLCKYPVLEDNTPCGNGGLCRAGACAYPLTCGSVQCPPNTQCTLPACVANSSCTTTMVADGTPCSDNNAATLNDVCVAGECKGVNLCEGVVCTALDQCHDVGVCDFKTGRCSQPKKPEATPCDDGIESTIMDSCLAGACIGVTVCGGQKCLPTRSYCRRVICEQAECRELQLDNTPCDDSDLLTTNDRCYAGVCSGLNLCDGVTCSAKGDCYSAGQCDIETGVCSDPVKPYRAACDDLFPDTTNDTCNLGSCSGVMQCNNLPCSTSDPCKMALCNATTCVIANKLDGSSCDDLNTSTVDDVCGSGVCAGVDRCAGVVCLAQSECHMVGVCNGKTGICTNPVKTNGSACSAGECVLGTCNKNVNCFGNTCTVPDPRCQAPSCNIQGFCEGLNRPAGTPCDDLDPLTVQDVCDGNGACAGVPRCDVSTCPELECKTASGCDALNNCLYDNMPDNSACDDGVDTTANRCLGGQCLAIADCGMYKCFSSNPCAVAICFTNECSELTKEDGAYCDDGDFNTVNDRCAAGVCVGTDKCNGVVCGISDECHVQGACNTLTGQCSDPRAADGTACNDNAMQSVSDSCSAGSCYGVVTCGDTTCFPPSSQCHQVTCNAGACVQVAKPNGTACNDENMSTTLDACQGGLCIGQTVTCANGPLRPDASPSVCATKPNANETVCPFGVCDGSTCCDTCLSVDAELCSCKALIINARSKRCPPNGCSLELCCSAGVLIADVKLTSTKSYTYLSKLEQAMAGSFSTLLNIDKSMVTSMNVIDLGGGQSRVDVSVADRPTNTVPDEGLYARLVQNRMSDDISNSGILSPYGFLAVQSAPSSQAVGTALVIINVTLQVPAEKLRQDEDLFLTALSKATTVPKSMLSRPKIVAANPTETTARVVARPCGIDSGETSRYIAGELGVEMKKGSSGRLSSVGFPLKAYAVSDKASSAVQGTLSLLLSVSVPPGALQEYVPTYIEGTGGIVDSSCVETLTDKGVGVYRLEAMVSDFSGDWDALEWSNYLRKTATAKQTVVTGVRVTGVQAEPMTGDCGKQPCGCGQRCVDDGNVDGVYTCRCRYPYYSGSSGTRAYCVENELAVVKRDAMKPETNKVQVADNLRQAVDGIASNQSMWGDGKWIDDAAAIVQQLSAMAENPTIEQALLRATETIVTQAGSLWSSCCTTAKLSRTPGDCCGDVTDSNKLTLLSNQVGDAIGTMLAASAVVNPPVQCGSTSCISAQEEGTATREAHAQVTKRYLYILQTIGEQLCEADLGNVLQTNKNGQVYRKQSATFGMQSMLLGKDQPLKYYPVELAKFKVVFEQIARPVPVCRTVVEVDGLTLYEGMGYPESTPVSAIVSVRYVVVGVDPRPNVVYSFNVTRQRTDQSANKYEVTKWDMASTNWRVVGGVGEVTSTKVTGRYSGVASGTAGDDPMVLGITEWSRPDNDCFACRALPAVWGVALCVVLGAVGLRALRGKPKPAVEQPSSLRQFLLTHYWTRVAFGRVPGFTFPRIHKALVIAAFIIDGWGTVSLFYPNTSVNYEWDVSMSSWVVYGVAVGFLGSAIPPTLDFVARRRDDHLENGSPPKGTFFAKAWRAVYFALPVVASILMFVLTRNYNSDKQEERYIKTFVAGALFNIFVFEPIRALIRMCVVKQPPAVEDHAEPLQPVLAKPGEDVELRETELFEEEEHGHVYHDPAASPAVLSSYSAHQDPPVTSLLSATQHSFNGNPAWRRTTSPENIVSMPPVRGRGAAGGPTIHSTSRPGYGYLKPGPTHPADGDVAARHNPLSLFSQYSSEYGNMPAV